MGFSKTTLRFARASGDFTFDPAQPEAASLDVSVDTASLSTDNDMRDKELRGAPFSTPPPFPRPGMWPRGWCGWMPPMRVLMGN
jgi:polyisoprenoid-binding protein YceI